MRLLKRLLISRAAVLTLILLILAAVMTGYLFPQRINTSPADLEKWQEANPALQPWVDRLGLDHVYTTPWFAFLLALFSLSLILSAVDQTKIAWKKTLGPAVPGGTKSTVSIARQGEVASKLRKLGYIRIGKNDEIRRFVKHPWGYWGNVLLHVGLVVVIVSSLLIVLTEKRGLLHLVEGEVHIPGRPWLQEETGMLVERFILPEAVRLDAVVPEFWETDDLRQLKTFLSFIDPQGRIRSHKLGINEVLDIRGLRVYQSLNFGHAFFVEFYDREGRVIKTILQIKHPYRRDRASRGEFKAEDMPYRIMARYFADAEKKGMNSSNPLLNLMLLEDGKAVDEVPLKLGETDDIGPYTARLIQVSRWTGLLFVGSTGMPGIFSGFFIIIMGISLTYMTPPREFLFRKEDGRFLLQWRASKFERFYHEECEEVLRVFGAEMKD